MVAGVGPLHVGGAVGVAPASGSVHVVDRSSPLVARAVKTIVGGAHSAALGALVVHPAGLPATPAPRLCPGSAFSRSNVGAAAGTADGLALVALGGWRL